MDNYLKRKKEKLNILLINPPQATVYGRFKPPTLPHMGLTYLAAMIVEDKVKILNMDAEKINFNVFSSIVKDTYFDIVGFTVTTPTLYSSVGLAKVIKNYSPHTFVIFGGIHPSLRPEEVLGYDCVDAVVKGEGEITFKEFVNRLKNRQSFSDLKGIIYKENGIIRKNPPQPLIDNLDSLPFPARHILPNPRYTYPDSLYRATAPIITSRGCPGGCTYCVSHCLFGRKFRARGAKNVVDEIQLLIDKLKVKEIHIWDDNFTTIKKRVFEIRDEILNRNLRIKIAFPNGIRADFLDTEVLRALKEMGTYSLAIGVESGSQEILDRTNKGIKLEKVEEIFYLAKRMHFETWAFFMIGLPGDNANVIKQTINFAKKIDPDIVKFHILKPYPGTTVYDYLYLKNFILSLDYSRYGIHSPPIHRLEDLEPADMLEWQKMAYISFYFRPKKILQHILRLKTLNRFILNFRSGIGILKMVLCRDSVS